MKIISLELETSQLDKIKEFYAQVLGFAVQSEDEEQLTLQVGFSSLTFRQVNNRPAGPYHFAFNIPRNKIQEATEWLRERVAFLYEPGAVTPVVHHAHWDADALYFYDTDFNILEFIAHRTAPATDTPFGPKQLIGLAEVGMPVADVPFYAKELKEGLGLSRWREASVEFEAVGNEKGMFIIVRERRPWFPTINPAVVLPARVTVQANGAAPLHFGSFHILPAGAPASL